MPCSAWSPSFHPLRAGRAPAPGRILHLALGVFRAVFRLWGCFFFCYFIWGGDLGLGCFFVFWLGFFFGGILAGYVQNGSLAQRGAPASSLERDRRGAAGAPELRWRQRAASGGDPPPSLPHLGRPRGTRGPRHRPSPACTRERKHPGAAGGPTGRGGAAVPARLWPWCCTARGPSAPTRGWHTVPPASRSLLGPPRRRAGRAAPPGRAPLPDARPVTGPALNYLT